MGLITEYLTRCRCGRKLTAAHLSRNKCPQCHRSFGPEKPHSHKPKGQRKKIKEPL